MPDQQPSEPRYSRPKVMLVDVDQHDVETVRAAGYRVAEGSLGTPLKVPAGDKLLPVPTGGRLPGFAEQESWSCNSARPSPSS